MVFTPRFDCHAHVYESVYGVGRPRYLPGGPAPLNAWRSNLQVHGLEGGVIVQVSFFGTDNSELLAALRELDRRRYCGIAVVPIEIDDEELQALKAEGIVGVRWNLVCGTPRPDLEDFSVRRFLKRLNRAGLHLQIQLEGPILGPYLRALLPLVDRVVVDHFGLPASMHPKEEPWISTLGEFAPSSDIWVKFSAPYRSPVDIQPYAAIILEILGTGQVVWGSDWPWTQHENRHDYAETINWAATWLKGVRSDEIERASQMLYGFRHGEC